MRAGTVGLVVPGKNRGERGGLHVFCVDGLMGLPHLQHTSRTAKHTFPPLALLGGLQQPRRVQSGHGLAELSERVKR